MGFYLIEDKQPVKVRSGKAQVYLTPETLAKIHQTSVEAVLKQTGGELPSDEELSRDLQTILGDDLKFYFLWKAPPHVAGEDIDMDYVIASVSITNPG